MKALSIQQPWADRILYEGKNIENRTWKLPGFMVGQRIYIHAGKKIDPDVRLNQPIPPERLGAILGEVTITGCVQQSTNPWFCGPYGFLLENPVAYATPIPCRGHLGFFTPDCPNPMKPVIQRSFTQTRLPDGRISFVYEQKVDPAYWREMEARAVAAYQERNRERAEVTRALARLLDRSKDRGPSS